MRLSLVAVSLAASAYAQGVTQYIAPKGTPPKGCETSKDGKYELSVEPLGKKIKRNAFSAQAQLTVTLSKGVLTDGEARVGYIADNYQFQFDGPPQAGAIFTGGWSFCNNGSLALGRSTIFYQCLSGSFYNLYDRWWAEQCKPINIVAHSLAAPAPAPPVVSSASETVSALTPNGSGLDGGSVSIAKATGTAATTLTANPSMATSDPLLGGSNATASLSSFSSSVAPSVSSVVTSNLSASPSASVSVVSPKSSSAPKTGATPNAGYQVGITRASNVALLMGALGMALA